MDMKVTNKTPDDKLRAASIRRFWSKKSFITHLIAFVLTNGFFALVNVGMQLNGMRAGTNFATNPELWFHWLIIAWFPVLAAHGLISYILYNFNAYAIQKENSSPKDKI